MKYHSILERCQSARGTEAILLAVSAAGAVIALFAILEYGLLPGLAIILLSALAFALARLCDLMADALSCVGRIEETMKASRIAPATDTNQNDPAKSR